MMAIDIDETKVEFIRKITGCPLPSYMEEAVIKVMDMIDRGEKPVVIFPRWNGRRYLYQIINAYAELNKH